MCVHCDCLDHHFLGAALSPHTHGAVRALKGAASHVAEHSSCTVPWRSTPAPASDGRATRPPPNDPELQVLRRALSTALPRVWLLKCGAREEQADWALRTSGLIGDVRGPSELGAGAPSLAPPSLPCAKMRKTAKCLVVGAALAAKARQNGHRCWWVPGRRGG